MKRYVDSPLGAICVECEDGKVTKVYFAETRQESDAESALLDKACAEISEFLAGERREFTVPFAIPGTEFERSVLEEMCRIPYGETCSYSQLAERVGSPKAVRAVGAVCAKNKILLIIPCHRVLRANGEISGYSGGIERKKRLLELERNIK